MTTSSRRTPLCFYTYSDATRAHLDLNVRVPSSLLLCIIGRHYVCINVFTSNNDHELALNDTLTHHPRQRTSARHRPTHVMLVLNVVNSTSSTMDVRWVDPIQRGLWTSNHHRFVSKPDRPEMSLRCCASWYTVPSLQFQKRYHQRVRSG